MRRDSSTDLQEATQLLRSIAEQLKMPLTTIARQAELGELTGNMRQVDSTTIRTHTAAALTLVDSYLLGLQLMNDQGSLALEPVSVSSILVDTAYELESLAKQYGVKIDLRIEGKYAPIMAHPIGLKSALLALGYALLEDSEANGGLIMLAARRTSKGITTGIYGSYDNQFSVQAWRRALSLKGRVTQPLSIVSGSGAGIFVAEAILHAMYAELSVGKYLKQKGLITTLQLSQQLTIV